MWLKSWFQGCTPGYLDHLLGLQLQGYNPGTLDRGLKADYRNKGVYNLIHNLLSMSRSLQVTLLVVFRGLDLGFIKGS